MSLSTCLNCGGNIPLGPDATNRCEACGEHVFGPHRQDDVWVRVEQKTLYGLNKANNDLRARVGELEAALAEAMEWNWLDDNAEETIPAWIAETLKPKTPDR